MKEAHLSRIAIIGCGAVSELFYTPVLRELEACGIGKVVAALDPATPRVARFTSVFLGAAPCTDVAAVLKQKPDLAIVASPPQYHASQSIELLRGGTSVLCEKPMAGSVEEAEAMVTAAAETRRVLAVGLFRRFFPVNQTIRDIVRNRSLGAVKRFEISEGGPFNWPAQSDSFFKKPHSQGGVLADLGVHVLDLLSWWFGIPKNVTYQDDAMGGLEANCYLKLEFKGGILGTVRLSRDTRLPNRTIIECERGWLRCPAASADRLEVGFWDATYSLDGQAYSIGEGGVHGFRSGPAATYQQSFTQQLRNVIAATIGREPVRIPGEEGLPSIRLIEQCYRERTLMLMPWLGEREVATGRRFAHEAFA